MILSFTDNLQTLILICLVRVLEFQMKSLCSLYVGWLPLQLEIDIVIGT